MKLRHVVFFMLGVLFNLGVDYAYSEETKKPNNLEILCESKENIEKNMNAKGYAILLQMTNRSNDKETLWTAGQSVVVTVEDTKNNRECLVTTMTGVTFNPNAIEEIWETYKKQTKQKDI